MYERLDKGEIFMKKRIIRELVLFVGSLIFLLISYIIIAYLKDDTIDLQYTILYAIAIVVIIRLLVWLTRNKNKTKKA